MLKASSQKVSLIRLSIFIFLGSLFLYLFYIRYYKWIECFNELERCYDPDGSQQVYTTGGLIWIIPATIFFLLTIKEYFRFYMHKK